MTKKDLELKVAFLKKQIAIRDEMLASNMEIIAKQAELIVGYEDYANELLGILEDNGIEVNCE